MNSYILLNEDNIVVNIVLMADEPVLEETLQAILIANNSTKALRIDNEEVCENSSTTIKDFFGLPTIGHVWNDIDTFTSPYPGEGYMLSLDNTTWIPIPPTPNGAISYEWNREDQSWI